MERGRDAHPARAPRPDRPPALTLGAPYRLATLVGALLATLALPHGARARVMLTVAPTIIEVEAAAGQTVTRELEATASGDEAIVVDFSHADFGFDDTSYAVRFFRDDEPETTAFSTRGWFNVPRARLRIAAGATARIPLRIAVPEATPGGTYLGAALLRVVPPARPAGAAQVQTVLETGPLLFIDVEGGDPPRPRFERFDVDRAVRGGPIRPDLQIGSQGDGFFTYEGSVTLSGPGADDTVRVERQYVVPGQPRALRTRSGGAGRRVELGGSSLGFGRYEVETRLRIEPSGTTLVGRRTVWVVPAWAWALGALLVVAAAASIVLLGRWFADRRLARWADSEDEPEPLT